jgi:hypothetical protein
MRAGYLDKTEVLDKQCDATYSVYKEYIHLFRFPNLEIVMAIINDNFTFEISTVTREGNSIPPSSRGASTLIL